MNTTLVELTKEIQMVPLLLILEDTFPRFWTSLKEYLPQHARKPEAPEHQNKTLQSLEIMQYQTLIGQFQWLISLGRFDISTQSLHCHTSGHNQDKDIYAGLRGVLVAGMEI